MVAVEGQNFWSLDFWPPQVRTRPGVRPALEFNPAPEFELAPKYDPSLESASSLESAPAWSLPLPWSLTPPSVKFVGRRPTKPGDYKGAEPPYRVNVSPEG